MQTKHHIDMTSEIPFWNRWDELKLIRQAVGKSGFGYFSGRRRIGKTALLRRVTEEFGGFYHQAVEGTPQQQLVHLAEEISAVIPIFKEVIPKTWPEFFSLLSREKLPPLLVFDEFPYWAAGAPAFLSVFQKWIDHQLPKLKTLVLVSGSSQTMLYSHFLRYGTPLYGRSSFRLQLLPMSYAWFCKVLKLKSHADRSFMRFSWVGGVPHYWKLIPKRAFLRQVEELYFLPSALLAEEPTHWLRDEGVSGNLPKALLDLIGRGVTKPSELASRLGTAQSNLSRSLALLLELGFICKQIPFGESMRSSKKVLYSIQDEALSFYYGTYLRYRAEWPRFSMIERLRILGEHAARHWEDFCRCRFPGAARYWEGDVEIDLVAPRAKKKMLVAECKWARLTPRTEQRLLGDLRARFESTRLANKFRRKYTVEFRIFSKKDVGALTNG